MARPTKYNDDILVKSLEYIQTYKDIDGQVIPTIAGLSLFLCISRDTVYDWADQPEKEAFSDIVSDLMASQELKLMNSGLNGDFNPSITKLALTKHNYTDKVENDNLHSFDFSNLTDQQLKDIANG